MPVAFYDALCAASSGLATEPESFDVAFLAWDAWCGRRKHRALPGYTSFSFRELRDRFGRNGFKRLNERYRIFDVHDEWSPKKRLTRGYRLSADVRDAIECWLTKWLRDGDKLTALVAAAASPAPRHQGTRERKHVHTIPRAVASRNRVGLKIKAWRGVPVRNVVPVDVDALWELHQYLGPIASGAVKSDAFSAEKAQRCRSAIIQLLLWAHTDVAGHGNLIQGYMEGRSSRLCARGSGPSLQSVPRAVRHAALVGHYDYDFESCHFKLLEQIGRKLGIECPKHLKRYNRAVRRTRKLIAEECDLKLEQVKKALLAVLYGACASNHPSKALAKSLAPDPSRSGREIGSMRAKRLLQCRTFRCLLSNVRELRAGILRSWPDKRGGMLVNDVGCLLPMAEEGRSWRAHVRTKIAHILQGAETAMLRVIATELGEQIEVLQHDGWTTATRLDMRRLRRLVYKKTGYRMTITEKRLKLPASARTSGQTVSTGLARPIKDLGVAAAT